MLGVLTLSLQTYEPNVLPWVTENALCRKGIDSSPSQRSVHAAICAYLTTCFSLVLLALTLRLQTEKYDISASAFVISSFAFSSVLLLHPCCSPAAARKVDFGAMERQLDTFRDYYENLRAIYSEAYAFRVHPGVYAPIVSYQPWPCKLTRHQHKLWSSVIYTAPALLSKAGSPLSESYPWHWGLYSCYWPVGNCATTIEL